MADAEKKDGKKSSGAKSNNYVYELVKGQVEVVIKDVLNEILPEMLKEILNEILQPMLKDILDEILADVVEHVVKDIVRDTRKNIREHLSPSRFFSKSPSTASLFSQNTDSPTDTAEAEEELDEAIDLILSRSDALGGKEALKKLTSAKKAQREEELKRSRKREHSPKSASALMMHSNVAAWVLLASLITPLALWWIHQKYSSKT